MKFKKIIYNENKIKILPAGAKSKTWFWSGKPHFLNDSWGDDDDNILAIKAKQIGH
jgi:hypothetical protein